ncbi:MAG: alpha/beta hydrolase, partial [Nocardioides sp.]
MSSPSARRNRPTGLAVAIAAVLVLVIGIGGGAVTALVVDSDDADTSSTQPNRPGTPPPAPAGDPSNVPTGLEAYYEQQLEWRGCADGVECATLTVPVDYGQPAGATFELNLKRVPATGDRIGSLVVNPGGPGAPGTAMADNAEFYFRPQLVERLDVVAFDPRGTGDSNPIDCLSDSDLDEFLSQDPSPDDAQEARDITADQDAFFRGCVELSDDLVGHVSTVETARDMDVLRGALREDQLTYLGFSYGTTLGAVYAQLFAANVGRFVLDGATDPSLDSRQNSLSQARGFQTALDAYLQNCVDEGDCVLGDSVEEGRATITGLLDEIDEQPLETSLGRELKVGNAFYGIVTPLYSRDNWSFLDTALETALAGDGSVLLTLSDSYASRDTFSGEFTDNSLEANLAINCLDDPSTLDPGQIPDEFPAFEEASPTFGRVFAWGLLGCHGIQVQASEPSPQIDGKGAAPIVVLGTTRDPATPYEEAVALASQLESGVLVSRDGDGHTAYNKG